jgi:hypothetical protein
MTDLRLMLRSEAFDVSGAEETSKSGARVGQAFQYINSNWKF